MELHKDLDYIDLATQLFNDHEAFKENIREFGPSDHDEWFSLSRAIAKYVLTKAGMPTDEQSIECYRNGCRADISQVTEALAALGLVYTDAVDGGGYIFRRPSLL